MISRRTGMTVFQRGWQRSEKQCDHSLALEAPGQVIDGPDGAVALREHDLREAECERLR